MANIRKLPQVEITNNFIFVRFKIANILVMNGNAKAIWIPATISGKKKTVSTWECIDFLIS